MYTPYTSGPRVARPAALRLTPPPAAHSRLSRMNLVVVLTPESESELLTVCAMLEARAVPFFVRSAGLGSLFPGPMQADSLNARAIMVPEERADEALALIADFQGTSVPE